MMTRAGNSGVTLIELLIVAAIISILAVALGFSYEGWIGNYRIESETRDVYSDLMEAKTRGMTRKTYQFAVLNAGNYQIFEDTNNNFTYDAADSPIPGFATPKNLDFNLSGWLGTITFDSSGLSSFNPFVGTANFSLVYDTSKRNPDYDCISVGQTRIRMGKMSGGLCVAK